MRKKHLNNDKAYWSVEQSLKGNNRTPVTRDKHKHTGKKYEIKYSRKRS